LKLLAVPFLLIGGIGTGMQLMPVLTKGPEYEHAVEHFGAWMLFLVLALAILGVGGLLWFLAERLMFQKAPLGDLAKTLFEGLGRGKINKVRTIATSICLQTEGRESDSLAIAFVRGLAFDILAETSPNEEMAQLMAQKAIPLFKRLIELGLNTPLLHFLLATSLRISKANQEAIAAYQAYLHLRPADESARKIMEGLRT